MQIMPESAAAELNGYVARQDTNSTQNKDPLQIKIRTFFFHQYQN